MRTLPIFLIIALACQAKSQSTRPVPTDNPLRNRVDSAVHRAALHYMQDSLAHGIAIGIVWKEKVYKYGYGEIRKGSGILPDQDHFYNLGSVAKTFVGLLLAEAVIEGKASLNDDIRKYMPGKYPNLEYEGRPIRLVDLANHTSGLSAPIHFISQEIKDSLSRLSLNQQVLWLSQFTADSILKDLHLLKPDTLAGTRYHYYGDGMMLLILIMERIFNRPYEELISQYLAIHLDMRDTRVQLSALDRERLVQGYDDHDTAPKYEDFKGYIGGPSMNSTLGDMIKYLKANLAEKDKAIILSHQRTWGSQEGFGLGLAWKIDYENKVRYLYHDGHTRIGFNTLFLFYPERDYGLVILVNDNIGQDKVGEIENEITRDLKIL
jgi:CubicO group peptidase (beta-lactamase class C family)